ncbi:MAG: hypothetical protein ACE5IW_05430 [bacterium]
MNITEYIAMVTALIALCALIYQMYQNGRQMRLQNFMEYTLRYQNIMLELPISIESNNFTLQSLNNQEKENVLKYLRAYFDLCSEEYYLEKNALIDKYVWDLWEKGMKDSFRKPAFKEGWEIIQKDSYFSKSFEDFFIKLRDSKE